MASDGDDDRNNNIIGKTLITIRNGIDENLQLFRLGCLATIALSIGIAARTSGKFTQFTNAREIPAHYFQKEKKMKGYIVNASVNKKQQRIVFEMQHKAPWKKHSSSKTILVSPIGIEVPLKSSSAIEWIHINILPRKPLASFRCYDRHENTVLALEFYPTRRRFYSKTEELAVTMLKLGLVQVSLEPLSPFLPEFNNAKAYAQRRRLGIWKDYSGDDDSENKFRWYNSWFKR